MSEFRERRVESSDTGMPSPAGLSAAAQTNGATSGSSLTRRELRAREREAALMQQDPAAHLSTRPAPAAQVSEPQVSEPYASPSTCQSGSSNSSPKVKVPRKPKRSRPARPPRPRGASGSSPRSKSLKRQVVSKLMTLGVMVGAGLMMVSTSVPANAFYPVQDATGTMAASAEPAAEKVQSIRMSAVGDQRFSRDNYTVVSLRERLFLQYGSHDWSYTNDPKGTIQWPFPIAVPISSGYGPRIAPCGGCSSFHEGVDFTPGGGTPIQAIADGVVSMVENSSWGLGDHVVIDHQINGHLVQSVYGHMRLGSIRVKVGQHVKVTDIIGLVGSTGASTGDHLHLEVHVKGVQVDPFVWLKKNAN